MAGVLAQVEEWQRHFPDDPGLNPLREDFFSFHLYVQLTGWISYVPDPRVVLYIPHNGTLDYASIVLSLAS